MEIIVESFVELFELTKKIILNNKIYIFRITVFFILLGFLYISSVLLTNISFLKNIDLTDPNNVAELQPITDLSQRQTGLIALIFLFGVVSIGIGKWQGFGSILGLILSFFTIYKIIVPLVLLGWNPVLVTFVSGSFVITATIFLSHGFNLKTLIAISGGVLALFATMILGELFRIWIQVSGYYGETTYNLLVNTQRNFDMGGIILSGIILAGIGLLDDMTITQSSVLKEIVILNPKLTVKEIYIKSMNVGKDHIGAVINSLFWAYSAASLPLLMLLNFLEIDKEGLLNYEFLLEEILRTVVSSMGLILAIPLTSLIGAYVYKKYAKSLKTDDHGHSHSH